MFKRNMWDHEDYHCPLIGTCLSVAELRKLAARVNLILPPGASDYELHGCFVSLAKRPDRPAKIVQKFLDRKFHRQMKRFAKVQGDDALWSLWTEMADAGDIPGAFWSVMRHSGASQKLLCQIFGEVHMLSHLVGASTRADLRRLAETQARVEKLEAVLAERKTVLRNAVAVWKRRAGELGRELSAERARCERIERERLSLRHIMETRSVADMERDREDLATQLEQMAGRVERAEANERRQAALIEEGYREQANLRQTLDAREREVAALELAFLAALGGKDCQGACGGVCADPEKCPCPRLRGKCVLYVGGRSGLRSHYTQLGERFGCTLLHHDGGVEQSPQHLQQMLARADAVVCPVDCVSHDACALVKRMCKGGVKPVHFARSSGLSSLATSLAALDRACQ